VLAAAITASPVAHRTLFIPVEMLVTSLLTHERSFNMTETLVRPSRVLLDVEANFLVGIGRVRHD